MYKKMLEEWNSIFAIRNNIYIYGAGVTAERFYELAEFTGEADKIKGFVVTNKNDNPDFLKGLRVYEIADVEDKNVSVLVPHTGVYKRQITELLNINGYKDVVLVCDYLYLHENMVRVKILDQHMQRVEEYKKKNQDNVLKYTDLRHEILSILKSGQPDFGHIEPYQSMESIGLEGQRPTLYRIYKYGLLDMLKEDYEVLDIGCNTGFIDLMIAPNIKSITGIEYDSFLVKVSQMVKNELKDNKCEFINIDFNNWIITNTRTYDVVFSFAIHHWLDIRPEKYVNILDNLLKKDGYIVFESHINGTDKEYEKCCELLDKLNFKCIKNELIKDDGVHERKFVIYKK